MDFYTAVPQKIFFADAGLLFLSSKLDAKLITFDKQLKWIVRKDGA